MQIRFERILYSFSFETDLLKITIQVIRIPVSHQSRLGKNGEKIRLSPQKDIKMQV